MYIGHVGLCQTISLIVPPSNVSLYLYVTSVAYGLWCDIVLMISSALQSLEN